MAALDAEAELRAIRAAAFVHADESYRETELARLKRAAQQGQCWEETAEARAARERADQVATAWALRFG